MRLYADSSLFSSTRNPTILLRCHIKLYINTTHVNWILCVYIHVHIIVDKCRVQNTNRSPWIFFFPWRSTSRKGYKGRMKNWTEPQSRGSLSKWSIFSPSPFSLFTLHSAWIMPVCIRDFVDWPMTEKGETLERDGTNIFHYKSLNTNWGKNSTARVLLRSALLSGYNRG
jgi:hypothetical protein